MAARLREREGLEAMAREQRGGVCARGLQIGEQHVAGRDLERPGGAEEVGLAEPKGALDGEHVQPLRPQPDPHQAASDQVGGVGNAQAELAVRQGIELDPVRQPGALHGRRVRRRRPTNSM